MVPIACVSYLAILLLYSHTTAIKAVDETLRKHFSLIKTACDKDLTNTNESVQPY